MEEDLLPKPVTKVNVHEFLSQFDNVLTDCDGVIWLEKEVIDRANIVIKKFQELGKKVFYITNNSMKSRDEYVHKLHMLGFEAEKDEIISPSYVIAQYLKKMNFNKKIYVIGSKGISDELHNIGVDHFGIGPDVVPDDPFTLPDQVVIERDVGAVIVGFDAHFSFPKLLKAATYLDDPDCLFLATNPDERFPIAGSSIVFPGTGTLVRAVETVAERNAEIMGKPSSRIFSVLKDMHNLDPSRTVMFGDRCNTDILMGKNCGLITCVVLSGVTSWSHLEEWAKEPEGSSCHAFLADYSLETLGSLLELIE